MTETEAPTNPPASPEPATEQAPPVQAPAAAAAAWRPPYVFFTLVTVVTLAADLGTKAWAEKHLASPEGYPKPIELAKVLSFVLARNRGGAWGILQDAAESVRRPFFFGVSALAIAFIVSLYRKLAPHQRALRWGLPLVLGGALGNLVDRIRYGSVVDFIDFHVRMGGHDRHWPTFNVADIAICVGIGLMAIDMLTTRKPAPAPTDATSHP